MAKFEIGAKVKLIRGKKVDALKEGVVYTVVDVKYLKDKDLFVHGLTTKDGTVVERRYSSNYIAEIVVADEFKGNF